MSTIYRTCKKAFGLLVLLKKMVVFTILPKQQVCQKGSYALSYVVQRYPVLHNQGFLKIITGKNWITA